MKIACGVPETLQDTMDGSYKILLVEDDIDDAEMTMYTLRKLDTLVIQHIDDGAEALQYLLADNPEPYLVLLDLKMPKVDGIQILRTLKANAAKKHIPIVALISSREGKKFVESCGVNADSYLTKPVDPQNFLLCLAEIGLKARNYAHRNDNGLTIRSNNPF
jgi:two-component system response regulator